MRVFSLVFALAAACATPPVARIFRPDGPKIAATAIAVAPLLHRFAVKGHEGFFRMLPVCETLLARGGLLVIGPDEVWIETAETEPTRRFSATGAAPAAARLGLEPKTTLALRAEVRER